MSRSWSPAEILPHRPPLLLLTRVVAWGPDSLVGEVDVAGDSPFAEPGVGIPHWVGLEYMAQAVGALDGIRLREAGRPVPPGYLLGTRRLEQTDGYFQFGVTVRVTVSELLQGDHGLGVFSCLLNDGERTMSCQLTVYRPAPDGAETGA